MIKKCKKSAFQEGPELLVCKTESRLENNRDERKVGGPLYVDGIKNVEVLKHNQKS